MRTRNPSGMRATGPWAKFLFAESKRTLHIRQTRQQHFSASKNFPATISVVRRNKHLVELIVVLSEASDPQLLNFHSGMPRNVYYDEAGYYALSNFKPVPNNFKPGLPSSSSQKSGSKKTPSKRPQVSRGAPFERSTYARVDLQTPHTPASRHDPSQRRPATQTVHQPPPQGTLNRCGPQTSSPPPVPTGGGGASPRDIPNGCHRGSSLQLPVGPNSLSRQLEFVLVGSGDGGHDGRAQRQFGQQQLANQSSFMINAGWQNTDFEPAGRVYQQDQPQNLNPPHPSQMTQSPGFSGSPAPWHAGQIAQSVSPCTAPGSEQGGPNNRPPNQEFARNSVPRPAQYQFTVSSQQMANFPVAHPSALSAAPPCTTTTSALAQVPLTSSLLASVANARAEQPFHQNQLLNFMMSTTPLLPQGMCDTSPDSPQESESQGSGDSQGDTGEQESQDSQGSPGSQGSQDFQGSSQGSKGSQGYESSQGSQQSKRSKGSKGLKTSSRSLRAYTGRAEAAANRVAHRPGVTPEPTHNLIGPLLNSLGAAPGQRELTSDGIQAASFWNGTEGEAVHHNVTLPYPECNLDEAVNYPSSQPLDKGLAAAFACLTRPDSPTAANGGSNESGDSPAEWKEETGSDSGYWSSGSGSSKRSQQSGRNGWNGHFIGAFSCWGLSSWLTEAVYKLNYEQPTPIQSEVMPCILQRHNVVVSELHPCSGKTSACVIAAMQLVNWNENVPQALLLASTRELAQYTYQLVLKLGESACSGMPAAPE